MKERKSDAALMVFVQAPGKGSITVTVTDAETKARLLRQRIAKSKTCLLLPEGRYLINIRNQAGWDPGGITRRLTLKGGHCTIFSCVFEAGVRGAGVRVRLFLTDARYPHIIDINGGIIVWQQPTIL